MRVCSTLAARHLYNDLSSNHLELLLTHTEASCSTLQEDRKWFQEHALKLLEEMSGAQSLIAASYHPTLCFVDFMREPEQVRR